MRGRGGRWGAANLSQRRRVRLERAPARALAVARLRCPSERVRPKSSWLWWGDCESVGGEPTSFPREKREDGQTAEEESGGETEWRWRAEGWAEQRSSHSSVWFGSLSFGLVWEPDLRF